MMLATTRIRLKPESRLGTVHPEKFLLKCFLASLLLAAACVMAVSSSMSIAVLGIVGEGLVFAHILELQHQCLHNTATGWRSWDRIIGILLGLPMLVSFSDRRKHHLHHHRYLGTPKDQEFFSYDYDALNSWRALTTHFLMLGHYAYVTRKVRQALWDRPGRGDDMLSPQARTEYVLLTLWAIGQLAAVMAGYVIVVRLCVLPLLVAIPCHVLIELPEHWDCDRTRNTAANTRTICAGYFAVWFTNGNNYHVEHHLCAGVSNDVLPAIHTVIKKDIAHLSRSYWQFYWEFMRSFWKDASSKESEQRHRIIASE